MTSPIEHALMVLSVKIKDKYQDDNLNDLIRKLAGTCTNSGFSGEDGFSCKNESNKEVAKITKLIEKL